MTNVVIGIIATLLLWSKKSICAHSREAIVNPTILVIFVRTRNSLYLLLVLLLLFGIANFFGNFLHPLVLAQGSFSLQAGFPKSEISGIEFASPSVIDINGDGQLEILIADKNSCIYAWNSHGDLLPNFPLMFYPHQGCYQTPRVNGPLAIGDVDGDGKPEIVAGNQGTGTGDGQRGRVFVWNHDGSILPGWPREMDWNPTTSDSFPEVYTVALGDLSGDFRLEVLAGTSNNASDDGDPDVEMPYNLYAWYSNGQLLSGFPVYYRTAGIYGMLGAANISGDGHDEVLVPRDHKYMNAYDGTGANPTGWPVETLVDPSKENLYMTFSRSAPTIGDLDHNGSMEIIVAGKVVNRELGRQVVNSGVLVLQQNGSRHPGWEMIKLAPTRLSDNFTPNMSPALADLDHDGRLEIIVNLFDGTIRAFKENGQQLWIYNLAQGNILYPSEPVIGDITGEGELDIIFGAYTYDSNAYPYIGIYALDRNGNLLPGYPLPLEHEANETRRGIRAAPTLADVDGDNDVEIIAGSWGGTLYVWDLPAPYNAELIPWPTARQNNLRNGKYKIPISYSHIVNIPLVYR